MAGVALLERVDLRESAAVALLRRELRAQEGSDEFAGQLWPNDARSDHQHVHVVVFDALVG